VQSLKILNKSALGVEENARNVVGNAVSSWGVVTMNAFSMLWSDMDTIV